MCLACGRSHLLAKESPSERRAREQFVVALVEILRDWHTDITDAIVAGDLRPVTDATAQRALERLFEPHEEPFTTTFETLFEEAAQAGRATAVRRYDLEVSDEVVTRIVRELRDTAREAADHMADRMTDDIREALRDAWDEGLSTHEIERVLREEVFLDMRSHEAERAARSEATAASARGALSGIRDAGAVGKRWLAEDDHRTRPSHRAADGQVVPIGQAFEVGGHAAQFPSDPQLPLDERMWCRCNVAPVWTL